MPAKVSPTLKVITEMRGEMREMRGEMREMQRGLSELQQEVRGTNARVDETNTRLVHMELRLATELTAVVAAVCSVRDLLAVRGDDRDRIEDHEQRLKALERKAS